MNMAQWVGATQGNPAYGTGFKSGYGNWIRSVESVNGNSRLSSKTAHLYRLEDLPGNFLKWGVTQDMSLRYSRSYLGDKRLIEVGSGHRAHMLRLERQLVETQPGPLNLEPWRGRRAP
jgi:hypothetical protein